jgi:hypothetical protein
MAGSDAKVHFELAPDEDDWPPFASESVWATRVADDRYRLDNVPFFVDGVALGDVVGTVHRGGAEWYVGVVTPSGNSTLRVVCFDADRGEAVAAWLRARGWTWEYALGGDYLVANVPAGADLGECLAMLASVQRDGELEYELSCARHPA